MCVSKEPATCLPLDSGSIRWKCSVTTRQETRTTCGLTRWWGVLMPYVRVRVCTSRRQSSTTVLWSGLVWETFWNAGVCYVRMCVCVCVYRGCIVPSKWIRSIPPVHDTCVAGITTRTAWQCKVQMDYRHRLQNDYLGTLAFGLRRFRRRVAWCCVFICFALFF